MNSKPRLLRSLLGGICFIAFFALASWSGAQVISPSSILVEEDVAGGIGRKFDRFGDALATGDFNGDGFADLAVGAPENDAGGEANAGAVFVFYGSEAGLASTGSEMLEQSAVGAALVEVGDGFGAALASGDFDADGYDDLAVGVPFEDIPAANQTHTDTGTVAVLYGSPDGLLPARSESILQTLLPDSYDEDRDHFGSSLAVADFNQDGFADLVVGAPGEGFPGKDSEGDLIQIADIGMIGVFFGSDDGLLVAAPVVISQESVAEDNAFNELGDHFGSSLAAGDFNHDGFGDVAVGIPGEDAGVLVDIGMVAVLFGSSSGLQPEMAEVFSQASLEGADSEEGDQFGSSLSSGDFDADGFDDLVVGILFEDFSDEDSGEIGVFFGSSEGLLTDSEREADTQLLDQLSDEDSDHEGYSLATGDLDGDGFDDLIAGVPFEGSRGIARVFFGSGSGFLPAREQLLKQSDFGGEEETKDSFAAAIAVGDFDASGLADMAMATPREDLDGRIDVGAVYVGTFADTDADGLTDLAESDVVGTDPMLADTDGDGMGDGAELDAGTDPLDPESSLRLLSLVGDVATGSVSLTWSSVPGRSYRVERSPALAGQVWVDLTENEPVMADGGEVTSFIDPRPVLVAGRVFYRVRVSS